MSETTAVKKPQTRDYAFDNIKALLILLVVLGHLLVQGKQFDVNANLYRCIYLFHMPLFVLISGYFSKKAANGFMYSVRTALIPSVVFIAVFKVVECLINGSVPANFAGYLTNVPFVHWYLLCLFYWRFATPVLAWLSKHKFPVLPVLFAVALLSGMFLDTNKLSAARALTFFPYYWIGFLLDFEAVAKLRSCKKIIPAAALVCIFGGAIYMFHNVSVKYASILQMKDSYSAMKLSPLEGVAARAAAYAVGTAISFAVISLMPNKKIPLVTSTGDNTLPVYILHSYFIYFVVRRLGIFDGVIEKAGALGSLALLVALAVAVTLILQLPPFTIAVNSVNKLSAAICAPRKKAECK